MYERACESLNFHCGQILLTHKTFDEKRQKKNFFTCLESLFDFNILPIINENDSIATEEICFGDNDNLAALIAEEIKAELTVMYTNVDGFFKINEKEELSEQLYLVDSHDPILERYIIDKKSKYSKGGIKSKLEAAKRLSQAQQVLLILNGDKFTNLIDFFNKKKIGTLFL